MNIIETAVTGLAFGTGTVVGIVASMVIAVAFGRKERDTRAKKQDEFNAETIRLLKIRASSSDLIASAIAEDTQHDKLVRAAVTGLCSNPMLVAAKHVTESDGTKRCEIELADDNICWAAMKVACVVEARKRAEQRRSERELCQMLAELGDKDDLTNTGENKK